MALRNTLLTLLALSLIAQVSAAEMRVGAASNLRFVLPELASLFEQDTGHQVHISFAASGTLASQIQHGAPFDIFMSASPVYINHLIELEQTEGEVVDYAKALLALYANHDSTLQLDEELNSLKQAVATNTLNKVVIANPEHAPYGQLAKQLLQQKGLWQQIQPHLLIAENAAQSLQFSMSPQVSVGFVPYTYVIQPNIEHTGNSIQLAGELSQQAVAVKGSQKEAEQWLAFLSSPQAKQALSQHGFLVEGRSVQ